MIWIFLKNISKVQIILRKPMCILIKKIKTSKMRTIVQKNVCCKENTWNFQNISRVYCSYAFCNAFLSDYSFLNLQISLYIFFYLYFSKCTISEEDEAEIAAVHIRDNRSTVKIPLFQTKLIKKINNYTHTHTSTSTHTLMYIYYLWPSLIPTFSFFTFPFSQCFICFPSSWLSLLS